MKIIGFIMVAAPFVGLYAWMAYMIGIWPTITILVCVALLYVWVSIAIRLINK